MPDFFPILLQDSQVTRLPSSVSYSGMVAKSFFLDDSEQRFVSKIPVARLMLSFNRIRRYDAERIRTFFNSKAGRFDTTWSINFIDGNTYDNCGFDQDVFPLGETPEFVQYFQLQLRVRQNIVG